MADGNGVTNGKSPWWATLIQTVGPTAAIALFLVYVLAAQVQPALNDIKDTMHNTLNSVNEEHETEKTQWGDLKSIIADGRADKAREHTDHEKTLAVNEQTCINAAKSPYQTQQCISARNLSEGLVDEPP